MELKMFETSFDQLQTQSVERIVGQWYTVLHSESVYSILGNLSLYKSLLVCIQYKQTATKAKPLS